MIASQRDVCTRMTTDRTVHSVIKIFGEVRNSIQFNYRNSDRVFIPYVLSKIKKKGNRTDLVRLIFVFCMLDKLGGIDRNNATI